MKLDKIVKDIQNYSTGFFGDGNFAGRIDRLESIDSIKPLLPYRYYDETSDLYYNEAVFINKTEQSCGFIIEITPMVGCSESDIDILSNFFNDNLPEGLMLQILNYASPRTGDIFDQWKEKRDQEGGIYPELASKRVAYLNKGRWQSLFKSPFTVKDFRVFISASLPVKKYDDTAERLVILRDKFISNLKSVNVESIYLRPEGLISLLDEILSPDPKASNRSDIQWDKFDPINNQICDSEDVFKITRKKVKFKNNICSRSFTVKNYPSKKWYGGNMIELLGAEFRESLKLSCPSMSCLTMEVPSLSKSSSKAAFKHEVLLNRSKGAGKRFWRNVENMSAEWGYVKSHLEDGKRLLSTKMTVTIFADKKKIESEEESLKSIYFSRGWRIVSDNFVQFSSFLSSLPFCSNEQNFQNFKMLGKIKTLLSWNCTNIAPLHSEFKGSTSNPCLMLIGKRGQPLFWNPFENGNDGGNFNVVVTGKPGSGKSVTMQEMVASLRGAGARGFIIDDGNSFKNSVLLQEGKHIEVGPDVCINPFTMFDWDCLKADSEYKDDIQNFFVSLLIQITRPLTPINEDEKSLLEMAVCNVIDKYGEKGTLQLVSKELPNICTENWQKKIAKSLQLSLDVFLKKYGRYFEGQSNIKTDNKLIVFELANLKGTGVADLRAVIMMTIMHLIGEAIYKGGRKYRSFLVIDEAWYLLHGSGMAEFIEGFVRRVRKYDGTLITGTQSINDYYKNDAARVVLENSQHKIFLAQNPDAIDYIKKHEVIKIDSFLERSLKNLRMVSGCYSEMIIYSDAGWYTGRLTLDPFSQFLYSSKAQDFVAIENLQKQGMDLKQAVSHLAGGRN